MTIDAVKIAVPSPSPLRKKDPQDRLYTRPRSVQEKLRELLALPDSEVVSRCQVSERQSPNHIPSECLVHLLRAKRHEAANTYFEVLYKTLLSRIVRRIPSGVSLDGSSVALKETLIRDRVIDRFVELLVRDRDEYEEKLDFYEVRFDMTVKRLLIDAQKQVWIETNRSMPLENPESGEVCAEVDAVADSFNPFEAAQEKDYRMRLDAAIDMLPPEQKTIINMLEMGFQIDSKDPEALTIAKALKRSEKTVRTARDKAFATIRAIFERGDSR